MNRLDNELYIEGVMKLQERMELLKNNEAREEAIKCNNNLTIAMLWTITQ